MMRQQRGVVGDVARSVGGGLAAPPIDPTQIQSHFGDLKGFEAIHELMTIVTTGVPVHAPATRVELDHALKYGNHRSANEYLPEIWEKLGQDVRRQKCLVIRKSVAPEIPHLRVSPLGAVVTHKVRIINDFSFAMRNRETKGGRNGDTDPDIVPPCLCATALPKFLEELVSLRKSIQRNAS